MRQEPLPLAIDTNASYMAKCRERFEENLATVARKAQEKTLSDVSIIDGDLRISPLRKNTSESAEAFSEKVFALINARTGKPC